MNNLQNNQFLEKLKSLGVKIGPAEIAPRRPDSYLIRDVVEGYEIETDFGSAFAVESVFPSGSIHGNIDLLNLKEMGIIHKWAKISNGSDIDIEKLLFLDTETSSLAGGAGTFIFMIGLGYYTKESFKVVQLFLEDPGIEQPFLSALEKLSAGFDTLVTFNGKSFDLPVIRNRYIFSQNPNPFEDFFHIDLLHLSRRIWKKRLASCRLAELEQEILGFKRSEEEIPGWLVPEIYHDYLYSKDARPLKGVFYHNQNDIVSMAALASVISQMVNNPYEIEDQDDLIAIGKLLDDLSIKSSAKEIYDYCARLDLPNDKKIDLLLRTARLHKHQSQQEQAVLCLEAASELGSDFACIQAAKYYEHHERNYEKALHYAKMASALINYQTGNSSDYLTIGEIEKRINRINQKIRRHNPEKENGKL